ncbi:hypothetical protein CTA2_8250 [Colletotrichum tanaceti]|nr:hypothetical protein CTA2_8250 [Colletotrichum tanaceti]
MEHDGPPDIEAPNLHSDDESDGPPEVQMMNFYSDVSDDENTVNENIVKEIVKQDETNNFNCDVEEILLIEAEMQPAKEAAEFAAEQLTNYPFLHAFQEPSVFGEEELEIAAKEVFARMAALVDTKDDSLTIQCRTRRCTDPLRAVVLSEEGGSKSRSILTFCPAFFTPHITVNAILKDYPNAIEWNQAFVNRGEGIVFMEDVSQTRFNKILRDFVHAKKVQEPIRQLLGRDDL